MQVAILNPQSSHMYIYTELELRDLRVYGQRGKILKLSLLSDINDKITYFKGVRMTGFFNKAKSNDSAGNRKAYSIFKYQ